jgi:tetratricopeptide (TPR) repeat protein
MGVAEMRLGRAKRLLPACMLMAVLLPIADARAQTLQDHRWCEGESGATIAQRLDGCSAVIRGGREKGDKLAEIFNNRGVAYRLKGDHERAVADYAQAIKLNPKFAAAFNNRGVAYDHKGDYDRAIADYDQAIKLKPDYADAYINRGIAYRNKEQLDRAIADYDQAIKLESDCALAYYHRGNLYEKAGNKHSAIADFRKSLELYTDPRDRKGALDSLRSLGVKAE